MRRSGVRISPVAPDSKPTLSRLVYLQVGLILFCPGFGVFFVALGCIYELHVKFGIIFLFDVFVNEVAMPAYWSNNQQVIVDSEVN